MKRKLSLFLILILAVQLVMAVPSFAADNVYTVNTAEDFIAFFGKDGAKSYLMSQGYYVKLTSDIDLGNYIPSNSSFTGTFDGQGHKISYNILTTRSYAGLIGRLSNATVRNVTVCGIVETGSTHNYIGSITGYAYNSVIENCESNVYVNCAKGGNYIGGITGYISGTSRISNCIFNGNENGGVYAIYGIIGVPLIYPVIPPI